MIALTSRHFLLADESDSDGLAVSSWSAARQINIRPMPAK